MEWDFTVFDLTQYFVRNLPDDEAYWHIHVAISSGFTQDPPYYPSFESLICEVLAADVKNHCMISDCSHHRVGPHSAAPPAAAVISTTSNPPSVAAVPSSALPHSRSLICMNCNASGHSIDYCWEPGGGDVGGRDRYLASRAKAHITTDLIPTPHDTATPTLSLSADYTLNTSPTPPSSIVPPVPVSPAQSDLFYAYALCDQPMIAFISTVSMPYQDFIQSLDLVVFAIFQQHFNVILDSGCTTHIICDHHFFWTYHLEQATPVGTANCGVLNTLARGEVRFTIFIGGQLHTICLWNCLHALDVSINLLSVGAMTEQDFKVYFEKPGTFVHLPLTFSSATHLTFMATVINHLSFLQCDFVLPPVTAPSLPLAPSPILPLPDVPATSFPHVAVTLELWHHRLGHLGMDTTRDMLTKGYADGIDYSGVFCHTHCIPCIIGKHPQHSYDHPGNHATSPCKLLHIDVCGPFPMLSSQKTDSFVIILDDHSNWSMTGLLSKKSQVFDHYVAIEAHLELKIGQLVCKVCCDGAREISKGHLAAHLISHGIELQVTIPYAHSQNDKVEWCIRTIEDSAQTLLADASLPPVFLSDAILTVQYLCNCFSTSTLPALLTPYEVIERKKPNLSHLRVWGCQCFLIISPKWHIKGGPQ